MRILLFLCALEIAFFLDFYTLFGVLYSIYGWWLVSKFIILPKHILQHPLSSFVVIGYAMNFFYMPIPATLAEGKPVTFNLVVPGEVFLHGMMSVTVVVISFLLYSHFYKSNKKPSIVRKWLTKSNFYVPPTDRQIWIMGGIGVFALLITFVSGKNTGENASSGGKFLEGFIPFAYVPYYLLFKSIYTDSVKVKKNISSFVLYTIVILGLALMSNHRATFMKVIMGIGFVFFLGLLLGKFSYRIFTPKLLVTYAVALYLLTGPLTDFGVAMVTVRVKKHEMSAVDLVSLTMETYFDKQALAETKKVLEGEEIGNPQWDEYYLDNIFLARLCNLKAVDLSLYHAGRIENKQLMRDFFADILYALLPTPLLNALEIKIDKDFIIKASYGDYLYYLSTGDFYGLESKRQANLNGAGMASFNYWYLLILAGVIILLFSVLDLLTFFKNKQPYITIPALVSISMIFTFFNFEGISTFLTWILRGWLQLIILYLIVVKFTSVVNLLNIKSSKYGRS